ncbi:protein disulfide-isomerase A6 homolog [Topomyia yanbarensis]|uniref:protein disulfide-isomerase A6 homolog n=1 Tax=Topomyia yanbarensis TaxID=2498891 RepID=UPI00273BD061|nr:protein disulfide-isomerase A6 homolog [Topomyia yanbarensis]
MGTSSVWITVALVAGLINSGLALYSSGDDVIALTESNFERMVIKSDEVWVVEFYAPFCGHCRNLVPEYKKAASALKGIIKVGGINCEEEQGLCGQHGVQGYPTIKIFGANKRSPVDYKGQRTAKDIAEGALAEAKKKIKNVLGGGSGGSSSNGGSSDSNDVVELTDSNFDKLVLNSDDVWLVEFFAPWCGHCKNLAPHWAKAASELKGKVKLGALDATVHTLKAQQFGVQGYPTIKYFPGGSKDRDAAQEYDGGRTASDIVNWALEKYNENIPAPEIVQLTSEKVSKDTCQDKPLCVISILPHILDCDAACRNSFLNILAKMGEKYKKKQWGWLWSEGGAQPEVETTLDIGGFGYPAMAVVNIKKMKYSLLRGSFSEEGINEFLRDLSFGRGHTAPVKGAELPKIHTIEPWDGKDGQLPEEEDIDLSDVDLDEKDEL